MQPLSKRALCLISAVCHLHHLSWSPLWQRIGRQSEFPKFRFLSRPQSVIRLILLPTRRLEACLRPLICPYRAVLQDNTPEVMEQRSWHIAYFCGLSAFTWPVRILLPLLQTLLRNTERTCLLERKSDCRGPARRLFQRLPWPLPEQTLAIFCNCFQKISSSSGMYYVLSSSVCPIINLMSMIPKFRVNDSVVGHQFACASPLSATEATVAMQPDTDIPYPFLSVSDTCHPSLLQDRPVPDPSYPRARRRVPPKKNLPSFTHGYVGQCSSARMRTDDLPDDLPKFLSSWWISWLVPILDAKLTRVLLTTFQSSA